MDQFSYLSNGDINAIENLYQQYKKDHDSVDFGWKKFFEGFEFSKIEFKDSEISQNFQKEFKVKELIEGYRTRGHLFTKTNPVRKRRTYENTISLNFFGLDESDLETNFKAGNILGLEYPKLKDIIDYLKQTYCASIGVEYIYNRKPSQLKWLINRIEKNKNTTNFSIEFKKDIYKKLSQSVNFESFLHKKFVGKKRFSLEGGECLIPALDEAIEYGAEQNIEEFVFGMAHRGRLNVLANIFCKPLKQIFSEFQTKEYLNDNFQGDVKYHLGYSTKIKTTRTKKNIQLTLSPNPSHLEAVNSVVQGISRSKIDETLHENTKLLPIIIHGDASISGQGIVYEVLQMSQLKGYKTGGTIHIVINNQIGFTTDYIDGRSSTYCTDIGKITLSPVFHINSDDVESILHVMRIAIDFRQKFNKDVFIDLLGYRKYGHNEGDEPRFTQPLLYKIISKHDNPKKIYSQKLIQETSIDESYFNEIDNKFKTTLEKELEESKKIKTVNITCFLKEQWKSFKQVEGEEINKPVDTKVAIDILEKIVLKANTLPADKNFLSKINKLFQQRILNFKDDKIDWALGEHLAYGSLLLEKHSVRISGQDVERGTFSHRHAVIKISDSGEQYIPLTNLDKNQAPFYIYNSNLSEYGVLGFEFGYSLSSPNSLVIWEAQFGDFNNGAQIMIDQFITVSEEKWNVMNGLVMFLPHGYEGQGSEHSSGRIERFLQLCAKENMRVLQPTTPANLFHALRKQVKTNYRKPLIVFTPKSLLRHPECISKKEDFTNSNFKEIIDDNISPNTIKKLVFCTGKIYYDLLEQRKQLHKNNVALIRIEQLYPFPKKQIDKILTKYKTKKIIWCQEEPENMGAYTYLLKIWKNISFELVSRNENASPASGSYKTFIKRQNEIINKIFE